MKRRLAQQSSSKRSFLVHGLLTLAITVAVCAVALPSLVVASETNGTSSTLSDRLCQLFSWAVRPIGFCVTPALETTLSPPPELAVIAQPPISEPTTPTVVERLIERVIERTPINEYITNEYITSVPIVSEIVREVVTNVTAGEFDASAYVTRELFDKQVNRIYETIRDDINDVSDLFIVSRNSSMVIRVASVISVTAGVSL